MRGPIGFSDESQCIPSRRANGHRRASMDESWAVGFRPIPFHGMATDRCRSDRVRQVSVGHEECMVCTTLDAGDRGAPHDLNSRRKSFGVIREVSFNRAVYGRGRDVRVLLPTRVDCLASGDDLFFGQVRDVHILCLIFELVGAPFLIGKVSPRTPRFPFQ